MTFEELLRKINEAKDANLPFVMYRMPQVKKVKAIIQKDERLEYSKDFNASGFIMAPFDRDKKSILFADENVEKHSCLFDTEDYSPLDISKKELSLQY
jgi:isochorismate synthase